MFPLRPWLSVALLVFLPAFTGSAPAQRSHAVSTRKPLTHQLPHPDQLEQEIQALLAEPALAQAQWGISVTTIDGAPVYSLHDDQLLTPASNTKLFTTAAAFALLPHELAGNEQPPSTYVYADVKPGPDGSAIDAQGHVKGNVVLVGSGDPTLSGRAFPYAEKDEHPNPPFAVLEQFADELKAKGVHSIDGDLFGDDRAFLYERYGIGWAWDDLQWEAGAPASALSMNDNVVTLEVTPGYTVGNPVSARYDPAVPYYSLLNVATTTAAGGQPQLGVDRQPGSKVVRLFGALPAGSAPIRLNLAVEDPAEFAALAFAKLLGERDIAITGTARPLHRLAASTQVFESEVRKPVELHAEPDGPPQPPASQGVLLASIPSPKLADDLTVINKISQNLHAELLLRRLGRSQLGEGSVLAGARVVRQFLLNAGLDGNDFFFYDGSGLSPSDLVTARATTRLLTYAARQPWGDAFRATLPVAGTDGTLTNRFTHSALKGKLFAKTGTLSEANALSGYITAASGRVLAFSILVNRHHPGVDPSRSAMDQIAELIAARN